MNFLSKALLYAFAAVLPICSLKADSKDEYKILASLKIQPTAMWEDKARMSLKTIFGDGGPKLLDHFFDAMARRGVTLRSDTNAGIYVIEHTKNANHDGGTTSNTLVIALTKADTDERNSRTSSYYKGWKVFGDSVSDECLDTLIDDVFNGIDDIVVANFSPKMVKRLSDESVDKFTKLLDDSVLSVIGQSVVSTALRLKSYYGAIVDDIDHSDHDGIKVTVSLMDEKVVCDVSCVAKKGSASYNWLHKIASDKNRPHIVFDLTDDALSACNGVFTINEKINGTGTWLAIKTNGDIAMIRQVDPIEVGMMDDANHKEDIETQYRGFKIFSKDRGLCEIMSLLNDGKPQMRHTATNYNNGTTILCGAGYSIDDVHAIIDKYILPQRTKNHTQDGAICSEYFNIINFICKPNSGIKSLADERCAFKSTGYFLENEFKIRNEIGIDDLRALVNFCSRNIDKIEQAYGVDCDRIFQITAVDKSVERDKNNISADVGKDN